MNLHRPERYRYGGHPEQFGDLYRPAGSSLGTVVLVHGGYWRAHYTLSLAAPLGRDLAARGFTAWNIEYRRVGNGGGWPRTFVDVAAAIDRLATLEVDTGSVVAVGHSSGGHLAVWAAGRIGLPEGAPGARPRVPLTGVIAQAGLLDLGGAYRAQLSDAAVRELMGGSPDDVPARYAIADPLAGIPLSVPVLCLHAHDDVDVPFTQSSGYAREARAAGGQVELVETGGDHFTLIDPCHPDWTVAVDTLTRWLTE